MCFVSLVMQQFDPYIPQQWPAPPSVTAPATTKPRTYMEAELVELLRAFRRAYEAAETFDEITGQPDCVDPEKAKLLDRVAELERKVEELQVARAAGSDA